MAGSASRIYGFCRNLPNSPGCPQILYPGPPSPPRTCSPYSIGTASGCSEYDIFYFRSEFNESVVTLGAWSPTGAGDVYSLITPIYPGVYDSASPLPDPIGYYTSLNQSTDPTGTGDLYMNTDNANFFWIKDNACVASIATTYNYNGTSTSVFFPANSVHYYNSTTCGQQMLNKSASFKLVVDSANEVRQIKITIKN